jgi:hypothetical protein
MGPGSICTTRTVGGLHAACRGFGHCCSYLRWDPTWRLRQGSTPMRGMTMGIGTGAIRLPATTARRWTMTKLTQGPITGSTVTISLRQRLSMWARTQRLIATPTHEAEAFERPTTSPREREPSATGARPHGAHHGAPTSGRLFCLFEAASGVYWPGRVLFYYFVKIFENLLVYFVILSMESEECYTLYSTL